MTRQRQILVTVTYNDLGCIIDTKAEQYEEPNLQPTCNNLATDAISREDAIDAIKTSRYLVDAMEKIIRLPSAKPEIVKCKDCKYCEHWYADKGRCFLWHEGGIDVFEEGFCNYAKGRTDG